MSIAMEAKSFTILFVDDEPQNLFAFKAAFRRQYQVLTANSGFEAIEILRQQPVQLVITDQRMPELTGVELLDKIRQEFPHPIRMIITGYSDITAVIDAINAGEVYRYITKPWNKEELHMTLENARQLYELAERNRKLVDDLQGMVDQLQKTVKTFTKYVPEPVVEEVLASQEGPKIKAQQLEATVLFCDIRNFTAMSEQLEPERVVDFLNEFYAEMTEIILRHDGHVNQFIGDEIFATFGAPLASPNNEENAVFCAMEMMRKRETLHEKYMSAFNLPIDVGIGINVGKVIAGNMGSEARMNYSIVGDTVNTCKRIESLTHQVFNSILISEGVYEKTHELIHTRQWEPMPIKGKKEKITVYEILGPKTPAPQTPA